MTLRRAISILSLAGSVLASALLLAETPSASDSKGALHLTAKLVNVQGAPDSIRIDVLRWSTEDERSRLLSAWELKSAPAGGGRGAGKGAAKAGKGAAKGPAPAAAPTEALVPEVELARALQEATTVGYLWSSELSGYALRYAGRTVAGDGSQRIVLLTQRRLGALNQRWNPANGTQNKNEFSVVELRLNAQGQGEGKASLTGKITQDPAVKIVALENYQSLPVVFSDVRPAIVP